MAEEIGALRALLSANSAVFEEDMNAARTAVRRNTQVMGKDMQQFSHQTRSTVANIFNLRNALVAVGGVLSARELVRYSDSWKDMESRLLAAGVASDKLGKTQADLFDIAQKNYGAYSGVVEAYSRLTLSTSDLQKEQFDLIKLTDLLSKTLLISGASADGAKTFYEQFGQAATSDFKAVGQEMQTFADQNPIFLKILKDSIDTGGQTLKKFAEDGKLSFDLIARAVMDAEDDINRSMGNVEITVEKAITQLDNALLKYIGNAEAIEAGTSSLALGISALAENFDDIANTVAAVAMIMGTRYAVAVGTAALANAKLFMEAQRAARGTLLLAQQNQAAAAVAFEMSRATGSVTGAYVLNRQKSVELHKANIELAKAQKGVLGGVRALSGAMLALVGGPVGAGLLAIGGAVYYLSQQTGIAAEKQQELNKIQERSTEISSELQTASKDRATVLREERDEIIARTKADLESTIAMIQQAEAMQRIALAAQSNYQSGKIGAMPDALGSSDRAKQLKAELEALKETLKKLEETAKEADSAVELKSATAAAEGAEKVKKSTDDLVESLRKETEELRIRNSMYGESSEAIERAIREYRIQNDMAAGNIKLTKEQQAAVEDYLTAIEKLSTANRQLEEQDEERKRRADDLKRAYAELGTTFQGAFEDAIIAGDKFSDVLQGLAEDIARITLRSTITGPLTTWAAGGGLGDAFKGIFSSLPSYDVGSWKLPSDQIAKVHKGEMIIPERAAEAIRNGGGGGGGNVTVNVHNNSGAEVKTSSRRDGNGTSIDVMLDSAMAQNISRPNSATRRALETVNSRTLTRR